jgi:hypothetical protein
MLERCSWKDLGKGGYCDGLDSSVLDPNFRRYCDGLDSSVLDLNFSRYCDGLDGYVRALQLD